MRRASMAAGDDAHTRSWRPATAPARAGGQERTCVEPPAAGTSEALTYFTQLPASTRATLAAMPIRGYTVCGVDAGAREEQTACVRLRGWLGGQQEQPGSAGPRLERCAATTYPCTAPAPALHWLEHCTPATAGPCTAAVHQLTLASETVQTSLARVQNRTEMTTEPHSSEAQ